MQPGLIPATPEQVQAIQNPPETQEQIQKRLTAVLQKLLDDTAVAYGYDSMLSLVSYIASNNPTFSEQAAAGIAFRDDVWMYGNGVMTAVLTGQQPVPTEAALLAGAPVMQWPQ